MEKPSMNSPVEIQITPQAGDELLRSTAALLVAGEVFSLPEKLRLRAPKV